MEELSQEQFRQEMLRDSYEEQEEAKLEYELGTDKLIEILKEMDNLVSNMKEINRQTKGVRLNCIADLEFAIGEAYRCVEGARDD